MSTVQGAEGRKNVAEPDGEAIYTWTYPPITDPARVRLLCSTGSPADVRRGREEALRLLLANEIGCKKFGELRATYADVRREFHQAEQRELERLALGTARRLELGLSPDFAALVGARPARSVIAIEAEPAALPRAPVAAKSRKRAASFSA